MVERVVVLTVMVFVVVLRVGDKEGDGGGMYVIGAMCVALTSHGGFVLALFVLVSMSPIELVLMLWENLMGRAMIGAAMAKVRRVDAFILLLLLLLLW